MTSLKPIYTLLLCSLALCACEKVIDIELNSADSLIVIEARINELPGMTTVSVSKTIDYFKPEFPEAVTDAKVELFDDAKIIGTFIHAGNGEYELQDFAAQYGVNYRLRVESSGEIHEATVQMPYPVPIDKVVVKSTEDMRFFFNDPADQVNYYRVLLISDNELISDDMGGPGNSNLIADEFLNGNYVEHAMEIEEETAQSGDSIVLVLRSINPEAYRYYITLENALGEGDPFAVAPANPASNWSNGALGYLEASSSDYALVVVP